MSARRSRGDGGLYWSESRQRWIAEVTIGYTPAGRRITRKAAGRTKTEAKTKLKEVLRDLDDGFTPSTGHDTVTSAVRDWLAYGLAGRDDKTIETKRILAEKHIIPLLGVRKLRELSADDVDRWLADRAKHVSTRTLQELRSILKRAITRAQARDKVKRNVVLLCELPKGRPGRPSKSLTLMQAEAVLMAAEQAKPWLSAYVTLSLLTGARTEELRELAWSHVVAHDRDRQEWRSVTEVGWEHEEFAMYVWRSVRSSGDTKTPKSRRTLQLPARCVRALAALWEHLDAREPEPGSTHQRRLVFATRNGTTMSAGNVRREFRRVIARAGLVAAEWTPREMRHSFVSLMSADGVPVESIARLIGHAGGSAVTEKVYRHQIRPVIQEGAIIMDRIFPDAEEEGQSPS
ncbi:site-specific integrase [Nonomuraea maheshkhaliensis]|uniref:Site-specific integrase n=1 Tax=Nonomuraea maheshkhaliensis TaxID=419590 RepID=A0ABP4T723_9ACTN